MMGQKTINKSGNVGSEMATSLEAKAEEILAAATRSFESTFRQQNTSKAKWFEEVARAGTFADRMSVVQMRVQQSPMYSLGHVQKLVDALPKKGHRESHTTLALLKDLFLNELLPKERKLITFSARPHKECVQLLNGKCRGEKVKELEQQLIEWKYEAELKKCYFSFLQSLENIASSTVEGIAESACATMLQLLIDRPEQESFLLSALVNKLGHLSRRVAARVAYFLTKLVDEHVNMRPIVVAEVSRLIFRKNITERAQHYAVHFLNRIYLQAGESDLAYTLIKIYLNLFKIVIAKCEHDHALIPLLITGINRAVPYARTLFWGQNGVLVDEMDSLYALVQNSKFSIALNVLKLLFNIHNKSDGLPDRFYTSFYRRLLSIGSSSLNAQFFAFFLCAVKNDGVAIRVRAFVKRLLQIALASPAPEFAAASLLIVEMIVSERPSILVLSKVEIDEPTKNNVLIYAAERQYDTVVRNPLFAKAQFALDVELLAFAKHYHPSVRIFAQKLIAGEPIKHEGDPLDNYVAMNFLEKFAFKNPKRKQQKMEEQKSVENKELDSDDSSLEGSPMKAKKFKSASSEEEDFEDEDLAEEIDDSEEN